MIVLLAILLLCPGAFAAPPAPTAHYFAATATDNWGQTSPKSGELSTTNRGLILAWNPPACTNVITNYTLWMGTNSGVYFCSWRVGTNRSLMVSPYAPSNLAVVVYGLGGH